MVRNTYILSAAVDADHSSTSSLYTSAKICPVPSPFPAHIQEAGATADLSRLHTLADGVNHIRAGLNAA